MADTRVTPTVPVQFDEHAVAEDLTHQLITSPLFTQPVLRLQEISARRAGLRS